MPRIGNTKICGFDSLDCAKQVDRELNIQEIQNEMSGITTKCDCKPSYTRLSYNVETSNSRFYMKEYLDLRNTSDIFEEPNKQNGPISGNSWSVGFYSEYWRTFRIVYWIFLNFHN
ncbi:uncharacterized protein LOC123008973 [Tribolium madens]|uniref:uncharacterized protein LOC123008973 n=1 Tax=Tribolium madens TaxID=41895 RepID=UPI001CF71FA2|nr:uncharacterized protein LOC123008973 [Tribolium madens]